VNESTDKGHLKSVNLQVEPEMQQLIDQAAKLNGVSRGAFMLEAVRMAAIQSLLDHNYVEVDDAAWQALTESLNSPPNPSPGLKQLMNIKSAWD
jgi:uncharacterized protein (DUF1778 family)